MTADCEALAELLAVAVEALEAVTDELDMLNDPDEALQEMLTAPFDRIVDEHGAMARVISRIARAAPPDRKRRLGEMCRDAMAEQVRYWREMPDIAVPVLDEPLTQARDALDVVRRRALVDGYVRDALAQVPPHSFYPAGA